MDSYAFRSPSGGISTKSALGTDSPGHKSDCSSVWTDR